MSSTHMGWTFEHSPYRGAALAVHLALADSANDMHDHELWASQSWIAAKARVSRTTVNEVLGRLVAHGFLEVLEDNALEGRPNRYRFLFPEVDKAWEAKRQGGVPRVDRGVSRELTGGVQSQDTGVSSETTGGVPRVDTNPIEPNPEPNQEPEGADAVDAAFEDFWRSWTPVGEGRGKGPKKAAHHRFAKLGPKLRERMTRTTSAYLAMCQRDQRPTVDCSTWLGSSEKGWRAWEDQLADEVRPEVRDDFEHLPPPQWTPSERGLVERILLERPPDMWEPAALRLLIYERPTGTTVKNALGPVPWPSADQVPPADAPDGVLLAWWRDQRRTDAA